jgi:hypothetical protein
MLACEEQRGVSDISTEVHFMHVCVRHCAAGGREQVMWQRGQAGKQEKRAFETDPGEKRNLPNCLPGDLVAVGLKKRDHGVASIRLEASSVLRGLIQGNDEIVKEERVIPNGGRLSRHVSCCEVVEGCK